MTFTGGGTTANWTNITNGALAGNTSPILQIITNPNRGSNEAYAITTNGVYHIADSNQTDPVPTAMKQWVKITGNLLTTQSNHLFNNPLHRHQRADLVPDVDGDRLAVPDPQQRDGDGDGHRAARQH